MRKKLMFSFISMALILGISACAQVPVSSKSTGDTTTRQISVTGNGQVLVVPDMATINIGVSSKAASLADAIRQNNAQAQAIKEVLVDMKVDEEDIQTSNFSVYPQSNYDDNGNIISTYFVVENTVYVTVRELSSLGDILDAVAESGANTIYAISFNLQDKTVAQKQARELAVKYAIVQAEQVAAAAGVELGEVLSINVQSSGTPVVVMGKGGGGYESMGTAPVPVSAGRMTITSNVDIVFAIK